jgi:hypothetical protein
MVSAGVQAAIVDESKAFGVPVWITRPLVMAESGGDPNASNAGHIGLLQLSPDYPGASGQNLRNPTVNLDIGLRQMAAYLRRHPEDMRQSLTSYEDVISHTGWDQWNGWANEGVGEAGTNPAAVKQNYINAYNRFGSSSGSGNPLGDAAGAAGGALDAAGNAIGGAAGAVGDATKAAAGQTACDAFATLPGGGLFAPVLCGLMGEALDPKKAILLLVAFLVLVAAAFHLLNKGTDTVLQVQQSAGRAGRAGGAIKKGAGVVGRLGAAAAV